ncbi:MAG: cupin-like domain-containing protein [Roseateles sp.]|uniref:cupin-like domain-containing protein n=1 Tax=Roseateles sp. TaxID=1971397 RepID=UPI0039EAFE0F
MLREVPVPTPGQVPPEALALDAPCVLRGLVAHWPVVRAARDEGAGAAAAVLRAHWRDASVGVYEMAPETRGRIAYDAAFTGFNFTPRLMPFGALLDQLLAWQHEPAPPTLYMGSTTLDTCLPGLRDTHTLAVPAGFADGEEPLVSLWLGNRVRVPAHQDWPANLACCASGRRRFTLYPPDAVGDLYVGPLEFTPAGQPVSLVDADAPDLARHPRFAAAQARAQVVELAPGDALVIPSQWWHQVESLAPLSALVNYWWRRAPEWRDSPVAALWLAMATVRDLPPAERAAWRALFDHYVFDADDTTAGHIPPHARGLLAPLDATGMRRLRALLLKKLNR